MTEKKKNKPGAGRPKGTPHNALSAATRRAALESGLLPHEWLLLVARGEGIPHTLVKEITDEFGTIIERKLTEYLHYPTFTERTECAKAAAPFFAPKLATQLVSVKNNGDIDFLGAMRSLAEKLPG